MDNKMYCNQCQEAKDNIACTITGVCGKKPMLANNMDILKSSLIGLAYFIKQNDYPQEEMLFIADSLFKLVTNSNFNDEVISSTIEQAINYREQLKGDSNVSNINVEEILNSSFKTQRTTDEDIISVQELIINGLMGVAAYYTHAFHLGKKDIEILKSITDTLAFLIDEHSLEEYLLVVDNVGAISVSVMALLDSANAQAFGQTEISEVNLGVRDNPGILVSGHDLSDLVQLLEQTKGSGVDVYTHCEMLPAHFYPKFKEYDHLVGNYGGAWYNQRQDFKKFNGPIIFTTNCIVPPTSKDEYISRTFTTNNAGHPQFEHLEKDSDNNYDFSKVIELAKMCQAPEELENKTIVGGFGHNQVIALADKIVEQVSSGNIKKFVVMAGCDGRHLERDYYTKFAEQLDDSTVILTAGCAKFRYNKLELGDINGIPRVLDAGQCNDSYSLAVIALKLKEVFELDDINDLPISYNIAWYEQKAVTVLLALLHLNVKNIKLGPTLPAFLSPNVANYLIDTFNISTISSVEEDKLLFDV